MIIKKEFNKEEFYKFRFMDEELLHVIKIPYDDFKIKVVPSYIEIDEYDLMFSTVLCISNIGLMKYLNSNKDSFSLFEMTSPYNGKITYTDKESFYMYNCDQSDIALISDNEKSKISNFNAKQYGSIFLVTDNKDLYLRIKLYI